MTATKFDAIVTNLAHQRVSRKIDVFRKAVAQACEALGGSGWGTLYSSSPLPGDNLVRQELLALVDTKPLAQWPVELWRSEEEAVARELLSRLDVVQEAMLAPAPADSERPAEDR